MITKRSISKPDSSKKEEPGEIAIKQTMTSHHRIARVHYPVLKPPRAPTGPDPQAHRPTASRQGHPENRTRPSRGWRSGNPKAYPHRSPQGPKDPRSQRSLPHQHAHARPETIPDAWATRRTPDRRPQKKLRRKEVIQPHLPVRLPCYDLVPITSLTLDGSIHKGLGHRLRVLPTFMT